MKLNLGCGDRIFKKDDWINVDLSDNINVFRCDVRDLLYCFSPESASLIYASHVLEYFDEKEVLDILRTWYAVLEPNGILRVAVPDLDALIQVYQETGSIANIVGPLYGRLQLENGNYIFHKMAYNYQTLAFIMRMAGFRAIRRWKIDDTEHYMYDDGSQAYFPHMDKKGLLLSLNVEGTK